MLTIVPLLIRSLLQSVTQFQDQTGSFSSLPQFLFRHAINPPLQRRIVFFARDTTEAGKAIHIIVVAQSLWWFRLWLRHRIEREEIRRSRGIGIGAGRLLTPRSHGRRRVVWMVTTTGATTVVVGLMLSQKGISCSRRRVVVAGQIPRRIATIASTTSIPRRVAFGGRLLLLQHLQLRH